ncbi:MAG: glutamate mutase L [Anaerolineales bacterium]
MSSFEAATLIAVDVGSVNTRANLFDVVDGGYRLVATGRAPSTAGSPLFDLGEGIRMALDQVQQVTGRRLLDENESLVMPVTTDGAGVDAFASTASAGPNPRTVLVGLMQDVSLESARRLAASSYLDVVDEIGLMDPRREEQQIDDLLRARPDIILLVGGTDGGATDSVLRMTDVVAFAIGLMPEGTEPRVVFAGNRRLGAAVNERLGGKVPVILAPNIRPSLELEDLGPTRGKLGEVVIEVRSARVAGFDEIRQWSGGYISPSADAMGRVIRYMSRIYGPEKGVLGVDLGASATTVAAAFAGQLRLAVNTDLGMGSSLRGLLNPEAISQAMRWLPIDIPEPAFRDYLHNKILHPATIPVEAEELHLEYALARQCIRIALDRARRSWPRLKGSIGPTVMPPLEPIVASGATLGRAPRPGFSALAVLDAVQPTGISTLVLDPHNLLASLGVVGSAVPLAAVQVLESGSFANLGTVVSPVGRGRTNRPVVRYLLERDAGGEKIEGQARFGQLIVIPLEAGEQAKLSLRPERSFDVGFGGPGRAGALRVTGGAVGVIVDARGRPLELSRDPGRRREYNQKWLWDIGALS